MPVTALGFREARINGEKTMEEKFKEEKVRGRGTENIDEEENVKGEEDTDEEGLNGEKGISKEEDINGEKGINREENINGERGINKEENINGKGINREENTDREGNINREGTVETVFGGYFLMCERKWVYHILIVVAGFFGAYTYLLRGNIFCNAQTGNVVLMGLALGEGNWGEAVYYLIPIFSYLAGAFVSELFPNTVKRHLPIRWDTLLIAIEMAAVIVLGFLPESAPVQISQVTINFIASMQYNTFRQAEGIPMATTFATNHIRQIGVGLAKEVRHFRERNKSHRPKLLQHFEMLIYFLLGAVVGTIFCELLVGKAIWITLIPLGIILAAFLRADLSEEKNMMERKPSGH